jgi:RND superfamily putative drug exporter
MKTLLSPSNLARRSAQHPWLTLGFWVLLIIAGAVGASQLKFNEKQTISGTESTEVQNTLEGLRGPDPLSENVIVVAKTATVGDPQYDAFVANLVTQLKGLSGVTSVTSYLGTNDASLISKDRHETVIPVGISGKLEDAPKTVGPLVKLIEKSDTESFDVMTVGDGSVTRALNEVSESDLSRGEMIGLPIALVVLVIVFGAGVAAGVPVILGLLGIFLAVGITGVLSRIFGLGSITINMITMIGLAVGIDYTLFIVERFREERDRGLVKVDAIVAAGNTASRAVLFSGITVMIALAGLLIVPITTFRGLSIGAITVVLSAIFVALTLLPAVMSLLGDKINWLTLPGRRTRRSHEDESGFFGRTTKLVQKHPIACTVGSVAILLAAAAPYAVINIGSPGITDMPASLEPVQAFKVLDRDFSSGRLAPTHIVIKGHADSPAVAHGVENLRETLGRDASFQNMGALQVTPDGKIGVIDVQIAGDSTAQPALDAVQRLRSDYIPNAFAGVDSHIIVGGESAGTVDYINTMNTYLPIVVAFVLTLSFVLLLMVFRSIVLPAKAIIMNLLSVGAAYGLIVLVFQEGVGASLFGFQQSEHITAWLPVFLFAVLFGLSMDYHVFLLSRIQERFLHNGNDNTEAVGYGLRSTAHIITGAAAIMMAVFAGFASGRIVDLQQMGFGLAVAVLIDATIVRSVLVPASMQLLGKWNWYLPSWLEWIPRISVEGPVEARPAPAPFVPDFEYATGLTGGE